MSSQGSAVRKTQSSINFINESNTELRVPKRQRTDNTDGDLLDSASTTTVIEVPIDEVDNYDVIKLDRVTDKIDRYQSHKDFLLECIREKVIPMGLRINLTPTIGSNDDEFVDRWHKRLTDFSITIIEDIVEFCDKTINETKVAEQAAKEKVKSKTTPDTNKDIINAIAENQKERQQTLKRSKQKKFRFLKYNRTGFQSNNQGNPLNNSRQFNNPQPPMQNNNARPANYNPPDIRRQRPGTSLNRRRSNTNTANQPKLWSSLLKEQRTPHNNYNGSPQQQPVQQHSNNNNPQQLLVPQHNNGNAQQQPVQQHSNQQPEVQALKNEIEQLKQQFANTQMNNQPAKNGVAVPSSGRDTNQTQAQNNAMDINDILNVISTTMQTLRNFENRYKNQGGTATTHSGTL